MSSDGLSRRSVLRGLAVTLVGGVAGFAVARNSGAAHPGSGAANAYGTTPGGGRFLATLRQVPVSGGIVLAGAQVVLTRDAAGQVHGFSAVCTHQGCTVSTVAGGTIDCPCHGSRFSAETGAVVNGPATRPLPAVPVTVRNGSVYTA